MNIKPQTSILAIVLILLCIESVIISFLWFLSPGQYISISSLIQNQPIFILTAIIGQLVIVVISYLLISYALAPLASITKTLQKLKPQISSSPSIQQLSNQTQETLNSIPQLQEQLQTTLKLFVDHQKNAQNLFQQITQLTEQTQTDQQQLDILLSGITDGVIAINRQFKVELINPSACKLLNMPPEQAQNLSIDKLLILHDQNEPFTSTKYCPDNLLTVHHPSLKLSNSDNQIFYIELTSTPILNSSGDLGWIITLHDVTEEQNLTRMKLDFASMAAHELRTPLTTVQGYLSFLQNPQTLNKLDANEQQFITKASISAQRLNKLIENVLSVSKIEQGQLNLTLQPLELPKMIEKLVAEYTGLAQTKNLKLIFTNPSETIPTVMADISRVEEVISNLIGNAVKYTERGFIEISVKAHGDYVITSVTDSGKGIPSDAINQLFTKFFRVQGELKSGSKGTGLGLYISKIIVESHGGKIWVESVPNQGSTFSFSLPITKNPDQSKH